MRTRRASSGKWCSCSGMCLSRDPRRPRSAPPGNGNYRCRFSSFAPSVSFGRALELGDVELHHLHERAHDAVGLRRILADELGQRLGHDLPRQAVLVLEPAALHFLAAARSELVPAVVDLLLVRAVHDERHRLVELEDRPAVQRDELLALDLEVHGHHGALRQRASVAVARDLAKLRVLEHRAVELRRFFGLAIEPEEWGDFLHDQAPGLCCIWLIALRISSGLTSRTCVATDQWWPNGSSILP